MRFLISLFRRLFPAPPSEDALWDDFILWAKAHAALRRTRAAASESVSHQTKLKAEADAFDLVAAEAAREGLTPPVETQ